MVIVYQVNWPIECTFVVFMSIPIKLESTGGVIGIGWPVKSSRIRMSLLLGVP